MPASAPAHTTARTTVRVVPSSSATHSGVYVPAIIRKMFEWSSRRRRAWVRASHVPRW